MDDFLGLPRGPAFRKPCYMNGRPASWSVSGVSRDGSGAGVLGWAYSREEATVMEAEAIRQGFKNVRVNKEQP